MDFNWQNFVKIPFKKDNGAHPKKFKTLLTKAVSKKKITVAKQFI